MKELDVLQAPLEGKNLVEASAGTGKTYTITTFYLRLILEKGFTVDQILAVTFTEAATEELKDRIRRRLREALDALNLDGACDAVMAKLVGAVEDKEVARVRVKQALRSFDEAAIFTIHGFCRRMLAEMAFETKSLFDAELVSDQSQILEEIVDDFFRMHFYAMPQQFVRYAYSKGCTPERFLGLLKKAAPDTAIIPEEEKTDLSSPEEFREAFHALKEEWACSKGEIEHILLNDKGLNRSKYSQKHIPGWLKEMDEYIAKGGDFPLFEKFQKFTSKGLKEGTRPGFEPPHHAQIEICDRIEALQQQMDQYILWLKGEIFRHVRRALPRRKEELGLMYFDDLLVRMRSALESEGGDILCSEIRKRFKAALIDEFQDTDPVQYAIFRRIFASGPLFLIGDPKQAIYSFRGADIFTYMEAARAVDEGYTLKRNRRSVPGLINAINVIFGRHAQPFVFDGITFESAEPGDDPPKPRDSRTPLTLWFLPSTGDKPVNKEDAEDEVASHVAVSISNLLTEKAFSPSEIAILVRKNRQARLIREKLTALRIPSVICSDENVFESDEASELEMVLRAIASPGRERYVRAALATPMIGLHGEDLDRFVGDEEAWEKWLERFRGYHDLWKEFGFMRMFREFMEGLEVKTRLAALPRGERRITNIIHLAELLHKVSVEARFGMTALLKWLLEQKGREIVEHEIRLESDEDAIKILTIHKSKGLEYPVVFCPYAWDRSTMKNGGDPFVFHDKESSVLTLDLGSPEREANRMLSEKEALAENMRILYVALTRAKERCYLAWGRINETDSSSLAYLFHNNKAAEEPNPSALKKIKGLSEEEMLRDLTSLGNPNIRIEPMEEAPILYTPYREKQHLDYRVFKGFIDRSFGIVSFSSLVKQREEELDLDAAEGKDFEQVPEDRSIFGLPKGARTGLMLHKLFERLDFHAAGDFHGLVTETLEEYGFENTWQSAVYDMVERVLKVSLYPGGEEFTLSKISQADRLNELEFYFPLKYTSKKDLTAVFERCGQKDFSTTIENLTFEPVKGFMRGFIDMVFSFRGKYYLVDWKSNHLGPNIEDYDPDSLKGEMKREYYILQYHIYTLALHQHLKARLPGYRYDDHFGGVLYLFLRGVDASSNHGVYRARPSEECIAYLYETLIGERTGGHGSV